MRCTQTNEQILRDAPIQTSRSKKMHPYKQADLKGGVQKKMKKKKKSTADNVEKSVRSDH